MTCFLCQRSFKNSKAVRVHIYRAHKREYQASLAEKQPIKPRWSDEEKYILAKSIIQFETSKDILSDLQLLFPHRTRESIKCQKNSTLIKQLVADLRTPPSQNTESGSSQGESTDSHHINPTSVMHHLHDVIRQEIEKLPPEVLSSVIQLYGKTEHDRIFVRRSLELD